LHLARGVIDVDLRAILHDSREYISEAALSCRNIDGGIRQLPGSSHESAIGGRSPVEAHQHSVIVDPVNHTVDATRIVDRLPFLRAHPVDKSVGIARTAGVRANHLALIVQFQRSRRRGSRKIELRDPSPDLQPAMHFPGPIDGESANVPQIIDPRRLRAHRVRKRERFKHPAAFVIDICVVRSRAVRFSVVMPRRLSEVVLAKQSVKRRPAKRHQGMDSSLGRKPQRPPARRNVKSGSPSQIVNPGDPRLRRPRKVLVGERLGRQVVNESFVRFHSVVAGSDSSIIDPQQPREAVPAILDRFEAVVDCSGAEFDRQGGRAKSRAGAMGSRFMVFLFYDREGRISIAESGAEILDLRTPF
jgi:hypothetical protein